MNLLCHILPRVSASPREPFSCLSPWRSCCLVLVPLLFVVVIVVVVGPCGRTSHPKILVPRLLPTPIHQRVRGIDDDNDKWRSRPPAQHCAPGRNNRFRNQTARDPALKACPGFVPPDGTKPKLNPLTGRGGSRGSCTGGPGRSRSETQIGRCRRCRTNRRLAPPGRSHYRHPDNP